LNTLSVLTEPVLKMLEQLPTNQQTVENRLCNQSLKVTRKPS